MHKTLTVLMISPSVFIPVLLIITVTHHIRVSGASTVTRLCVLTPWVMLLVLQNAVSKNATQFKGNAQHDAQEFLLWLLDRVHEDLNTVNPITRPPIKVSVCSSLKW